MFGKWQCRDFLSISFPKKEKQNKEDEDRVGVFGRDSPFSAGPVSRPQSLLSIHPVTVLQ